MPVLGEEVGICYAQEGGAMAENTDKCRIETDAKPESPISVIGSAREWLVLRE